MALPHKQTNISYADYLSWDEEEFRCEVLDGKIINMTPAPTPRHQQITDELTAEFKMYLRGKECTAFSAPIDVCLFASDKTSYENIKNWVQPDLVVVCDKNKINDKNILGVPDLVVEVLSPSTAKTDRVIKFNTYEKAGVKEYWIVDPLNESIEVYLHKEGHLKPDGVYLKGEKLQVTLFEDLQIDLNVIFDSY